MIQILRNANIIDLNDKNRKDSVLVLNGDTITARGGEELIDQFGVGVHCVNMEGKIILPTFTDAHIHLLNFAYALDHVNVETRTKSEALERVRERCAAVKPGEWVLGNGWQHNDWGGQLPTKHELDAVSPLNPVYLYGKSLHVGWANSLAIAAAGVSNQTADPENGRIVRDAHGAATGIFLESAMLIPQNAIPEKSVAESDEVLKRAFKELHKYGITSVHDFDYKLAFQTYQSMDAADELGVRITKSVPVELLDHAIGMGLRSGFGSKKLRIGAVKLFMDGALGPRTAAMVQPYEGDPGNTGILNMDTEGFVEVGKKAIRGGLSITAHAIGDMANHVLLDGFGTLNGIAKMEDLGGFRHRIEHVQLLHKDDVPRLAKLGVTASMQPIHAISDMEAADRYWGERARYSYAWRSQLREGAELIFGSDAPVESPNPFWGIYAAITREKLDKPGSGAWIPEETIGLNETLKAYIQTPSRAGYFDGIVGKLEAGFAADLMVLSKDPFELSAEQIRDLLPERVMFAGEWQ